MTFKNVQYTDIKICVRVETDLIQFTRICLLLCAFVNCMWKPPSSKELSEVLLRKVDRATLSKKVISSSECMRPISVSFGTYSHCRE